MTTEVWESILSDVKRESVATYMALRAAVVTCRGPDDVIIVVVNPVLCRMLATEDRAQSAIRRAFNLHGRDPQITVQTMMPDPGGQMGHA